MKCVARFPRQNFSNPVFFFSHLEPWADLQKKTDWVSKFLSLDSK